MRAGAGRADPPRGEQATFTTATVAGDASSSSPPSPSPSPRSLARSLARLILTPFVRAAVMDQASQRSLASRLDGHAGRVGWGRLGYAYVCVYVCVPIVMVPLALCEVNKSSDVFVFLS